MKKIVFLILFIIVLTLLVFQCSDPVRPNEENNDTTIYQEIVSDNYIEGSAGWAILNDGSGQLANGNITWDTAGNVTIKQSITCPATITGGAFRTAAAGTYVKIDQLGVVFWYDGTKVGGITAITADQIGVSTGVTFVAESFWATQAINTNVGYKVKSLVGSEGQVLRSDGINGFVIGNIQDGDLPQNKLSLYLK